MNPNWIVPTLTCLGLVVNAVWTAVNLQMRADLARQISDLKEWMAEEYVSEKICRARHGEKVA